MGEKSTAIDDPGPQVQAVEHQHLISGRPATVDGETDDPLAVQQITNETDDADDSEKEQTPVARPENEMSEEEFWFVFQVIFSTPGNVNPLWEPLAIQPKKIAGARAASDSTFALLQMYYPKILLKGSATFGHLVVVLPFMGGQVMIAREIARTYRDQKQAEQQSDQGFKSSRSNQGTDQGRDQGPDQGPDQVPDQEQHQAGTDWIDAGPTA
jgi:hypothetical protein